MQKYYRPKPPSFSINQFRKMHLCKTGHMTELYLNCLPFYHCKRKGQVFAVVNNHVFGRQW